MSNNIIQLYCFTSRSWVSDCAGSRTAAGWRWAGGPPGSGASAAGHPCWPLRAGALLRQPRTLSTTSAVSRLADSCVQAIISLLPHTSWALLTPPSSTVTTGVQFRCFPRQPRPRTVCGGLLNVHYISPHNRHNVFSVQCHYDQPPAAGVMIKQFDSTNLHHNNINLETLVCCTRWAVACLAHKNISWHLLLCYDSHHRKDTAPATHIFS